MEQSIRYSTSRIIRQHNHASSTNTAGDEFPRIKVVDSNLYKTLFSYNTIVVDFVTNGNFIRQFSCMISCNTMESGYNAYGMLQNLEGCPSKSSAVH